MFAQRGGDLPVSCIYHPERDAIGTCMGCGGEVCEFCRTVVDGITYCPLCVDKIMAGSGKEASEPEKQPPEAAAAADASNVSPAKLSILGIFIYIFGGCLIWYSMGCFSFACAESMLSPHEAFGKHLWPMVFSSGVFTILSGPFISAQRGRAWLFGVLYLIVAMVVYATAHGLLFRAPSHERSIVGISIFLLSGVSIYLFFITSIIRQVAKYGSRLAGAPAFAGEVVERSSKAGAMGMLIITACGALALGGVLMPWWESVIGWEIGRILDYLLLNYTFVGMLGISIAPYMVLVGAGLMLASALPATILAFNSAEYRDTVRILARFSMFGAGLVIMGIVVLPIVILGNGLFLVKYISYGVWLVLAASIVGLVTSFLMSRWGRIKQSLHK